MHSCYQPSSRLTRSIVRASGRLLSIALPFSPPVPHVHPAYTRILGFPISRPLKTVLISSSLCDTSRRVSCLACGYADRESAEARPGEEGKKGKKDASATQKSRGNPADPKGQTKVRRRNSLASHSFFFFRFFSGFKLLYSRTSSAARCDRRISWNCVACCEFSIDFHRVP